MGAKSDRAVPVSDFFALDTFTTALEPGEIVREVIVPLEDAGTGTSYQKMQQPASGFAIVGIATRIRKTGGKIAMARIGVTGLANCSYRAMAVEKALEGTTGSVGEIQNAAALVAEGADANSDLHASVDYRRHLAVVYTARAILSSAVEVGLKIAGSSVLPLPPEGKPTGGCRIRTCWRVRFPDARVSKKPVKTPTG